MLAWCWAMLVGVIASNHQRDACVARRTRAARGGGLENPGELTRHQARLVRDVSIKCATIEDGGWACYITHGGVNNITKATVLGKASCGDHTKTDNDLQQCEISLSILGVGFAVERCSSMIRDSRLLEPSSQVTIIGVLSVQCLKFQIQNLKSLNSNVKFEFY